MKPYFNFTRKQKIGVISLSSIIVFLIVVMNVNYHRAMPNPLDVDTANISFFSIDQTDSIHIYKNDGNSGSNHSYTESYKNYTLFKFDPNALAEDGWQELGFSKNQASAIVKYRNSYGPFASPVDVAKIYVISDEKFEEIEPYMLFDEKEISSGESSSNLPIDVNAVNAEDLEAIKGIGPTFSKRAIKYRDVLGGYASADQFNEIYGINDEAVNALTENTTIDQGQIIKIKINTSSKDQIKKHPYLKDWELVTAIIQERDRKHINSLKFLIEKGLLNQTEVDKLTPYISFE